MAKITTVNYTNESFKTYLMKLSNDIVWKNSSLAKKYETNTDPYLSELFVTANRGLLSFDIIKAFPRVILRSIGLPETQINECASDKNKIPTNLRSFAVSEYQSALTSINPDTGRLGYETADGWVSLYEEQNDYYRMLNGLPSISATKYIYNTNQKYPTDIPVHELSLVERLEMEEDGTLAKLIEANPSAEYLKYCGSKMISIYKARVANRFEILHRNNIDSSTLENDFDSVYESCANLVNSVYYSEAFKKTNVLYENFLAMSILFMTIQTMQYHYLSVDVIRDFYDTDSLKYVYDSYSVPFYNEIPLEYHRKIVKNINQLIGYKGSSQVFFDLFDIFNTDMNIYTYYLTKVHRFNDDGTPEFTIETDEDDNELYDKNGNPVLAASNYNIAFSKGEIYADPALSVADSANKSEYEDIISQDSYWVEDANVKQILDDTSFNFNETKYVGVQTVFDLLKITYENAYVFKMIMDNKTITDRLILQWPDLEIEASFYEVFIYLAAIVCAYHGYEGNISDSLPYTAAVLGYDFQNSTSILKNYVETNSYLKRNTDLREKIRSMVITNVNSVSSTFSNLQEIESMLIDGYINATSKEEFEAYRDLYNSLMTSKIIDEVYTLKDGTLAENFSELLRSQSPDLYTRYLGVVSGDIESELTVIIDKLEDNLISLKYAPHSLGIESSSLIENLFRILKFFKSAKAEIVGYNVIYKISGRGINFFKIMDECIGFHMDGKFDNDMYMYDLFTYIRSLVRLKNAYIMMDDNDGMLDNAFFFTNEDRILWINDMLKVTAQMFPPLEDEQHYIDFFIKTAYKSMLGDEMKSKDAFDAVDAYFEKGPPVFIYKELKEIIDSLIILNVTPFIIDSYDFNDILKYVYENVVQYLELNHDNIMKYDLLFYSTSGEVSSEIKELILSEISRIYAVMMSHDKFDMSDLFKAVTQSLAIGQDDHGFIEFITKAAYNSTIEDKLQSQEAFDVIDAYFEKGTPIAFYDDSHELLDDLILLVMLPHILEEMNTDDMLKEVYETVTDYLVMNQDNIMKHDLMYYVTDGEVSSEMENLILTHITAIYKILTINSSSFKMSDSFEIQLANINFGKTNSAGDSGIPNSDAFIIYSESRNSLIQNKVDFTDCFIDEDGNPLI